MGRLEANPAEYIRRPMSSWSPPPSLAARARGALLGHAAGNALGVPTEFLGTADRIAREFPGGLQEVLRQDSEQSPYDDDLALTLLLAEELLQPEMDFRRSGPALDRVDAARWPGIGIWTRTALEHIAQHDSPPGTTGGQAGNGPVSRCLPVALATHRTPANLVSGTYHTAILTHPDERCAWAAVAVNVAAARFLLGKRDFIPDVIEALRNNDAPDELLAAARRVPLETRDDLPVQVLMRDMRFTRWRLHSGSPTMSRTSAGDWSGWSMPGRYRHQCGDCRWPHAGVAMASRRCRRSGSRPCLGSADQRVGGTAGGRRADSSTQHHDAESPVLKLIYKWHKWIGVSVGVILAMWLFTGIIMVTGPRPPSPPIPRLDFSAAVISPAQASAKSRRAGYPDRPDRNRDGADLQALDGFGDCPGRRPERRAGRDQRLSPW